jgi:hypothetical protein
MCVGGIELESVLTNEWNKDSAHITLRARIQIRLLPVTADACCLFVTTDLGCLCLLVSSNGGLYDGQIVLQYLSEGQ